MAVTLSGRKTGRLGGKPANRTRSAFNSACLSVALHPWAELARPRKAAIEGGAATGAAVGTHPAAATYADPVHDRHADSGALERFRRVQAPQRAADPARGAPVAGGAGTPALTD